FAAAGSGGASGTLVAAWSAPLSEPGPEGKPQRQFLEATELFSGKTARLPLDVTPAEVPLPLTPSPPKGPPPHETPLPPGSAATGAKQALDWLPAETGFGPHVRDLVVSADGSLAVMNTMNWDHNLYALDVATGQVRWRQRAGQYFAFAPQALAGGVAGQGFDFESGEGYHLYLAKADGSLQRRFALYGLPKRLPQRFVPGIFNDRLNNFAVPADGSWVAGAGDLGLAVWDRGGKLLWSQDWWKSRRHTARLAALSGGALLVLEGMNVEAYEAATGKALWQQTLAATGEVLETLPGPDGKTVAVLTTTAGGRLFVLRDGKVTHTLPVVGASAAALSPDGSRVAVVAANQLRLLDVAGGLQWSLPADDTLHFPRFAGDGKRVAVCSELGTVYVVDANGKILMERDLGALTVPFWLADGDLLLGTWMGTICRLDGRYAERWRTRLEPAAPDMRGKILARDATPTSRVEGWGNADPPPAALIPNLLDPKHVLIKFKWPAASYVQLVHDPALLVDGKAE